MPEASQDVEVTVDLATVLHVLAFLCAFVGGVVLSNLPAVQAILAWTLLSLGGVLYAEALHRRRRRSL